MQPHNLNPNNPYFYKSQRDALERERDQINLVRQAAHGVHHLKWARPLWTALGRLLVRVGQQLIVEEPPVEAPRVGKSFS